MALFKEKRFSIPINMKKTPAFGIEHIHAVRKTQPDQTPVVFKHVGDLTAANGKGVERILGKYFKSGAVVAVQSVIGRDPEETVAAWQDVIDHALRQPVSRGQELDARIALGVRSPGAQEQDYDNYLFQTGLD